jgi:hypothetical protein
LLLPGESLPPALLCACPCSWWPRICRTSWLDSVTNVPRAAVCGVEAVPWEGCANLGCWWAAAEAGAAAAAVAAAAAASDREATLEAKAAVMLKCCA